MRAKAVVVQDEVLERHMGGEEGHKGSLCVEPKGVIVEVDGM